jgi:uncharacterized membrane protein
MKDTWRHRRRLVAILLGAFLLRSFNLGGKSFWLDEAVSVAFATPTLSAVDRNHPPLYYTVLYHWMALFDDGEVMTRLLSVLVSLLGVAVLYAVARRLFTRRVALTAATLMALSPLGIWYARETRMYATMALLVLLMVLGLTWGNWKGFVLYFAALSAAWYLSYLTLPLWLGLSVLWLAHWWQQGHRLPPLLLWLAASGAAWALYRPWWPHFQQWVDGALLRHWIAAAVGDRLGLEQLTLAHFLLPMAAAVLVLFIAGIILPRLLRSHRPRRLITALVLPAFAAFLWIVPVPRLYSLKRLLVTGWPLVILLAAWLVAHLSQRRRTVRRALFALSLAAALVTLVLVPRDDWRGATTYLDRNTGDAGVVVWVDPPWNTIPYNYYDPRHPVLTPNNRDLQEIAAGSNDIWLIAERFHGKPIPSSPSEAWLNDHWELVETVPFYRLSLRHYRRPPSQPASSGL